MSSARPQECVGKVNLPASAIGKGLIVLVCDNSDDFGPFRRRRADADENAFTDCRLVRKGFVGQNLVEARKVRGIGSWTITLRRWESR